MSLSNAHAKFLNEGHTNAFLTHANEQYVAILRGINAQLRAQSCPSNRNTGLGRDSNVCTLLVSVCLMYSNKSITKNVSFWLKICRDLSGQEDHLFTRLLVVRFISLQQKKINNKSVDTSYIYGPVGEDRTLRSTLI
jgi:hypothetical protein